MGYLSGLNAQVNNIRFQHLKSEDGLSQGHVLCMLQDKEGYIWIGTYYGLNRYNGYSFKLFSKNNEDTCSIISDVVYSLFEDKDGVLWVGTVSGLEKYNKKTETFEHIPSNVVGGLAGSDIRTIKQDVNGNIWVGSYDGGLSKIDQETGKISHFNLPGKKQIINDFLIDKNNRLWVASATNGLSVINLNNNEVKTYLHDSMKPFSLPQNNITSIFSDAENTIWMGFPNGDLAKYIPQSDGFQIHQVLSEECKDQSISVRDISQDFSGNILVATLGAGLISYNPLSGKSKIYLHNNNNSQTISSNEAYSLMIDRTGTVFVGTYGRGISKYAPSNNKFSTYYVSTRDEKEGDMNSYTSCVQDAKGRLIVGTYYGFYVYDKKRLKYRHIIPGNTFADNKILSMAIAPDSTIWMGTKKGLHRYDKDLNKIRTYQLLNDDAEHPIYELYFDSKNNLWLGLFVVEGLFKITEKEWRNTTSERLDYKLYKEEYNSDSTSIYGNQIWAINQDAYLNLWIGTNMGICKYNYKNDNFERYDITKLCKSIEFDNKNNMWIATRGAGVICYNLKTQEVKHYTDKEGLSQNFVFGIIIDENEQIWLTTENGLSKLNPETENFRNYDIFDGLPHNQFDDRSELKLENGEVYMGTSKGFMIFEPTEVLDDTSKTNVVLTKLRISNKDIEYDHLLGDKNRISLPIGQLSEFELFPGQKDFSLEFAALHYTASQRVKYKYKLEGFDAEWIYTDASNRTVRYTNLDGGNYIFKVMATNGDGFWNETPLTVDIIVYPPFYKTSLFKTLFVVILLLVVILFFRWRMTRVKKRNIILESLVNERTREILEKNQLLNKNARDLNEKNTLLETKQHNIEQQKEELAAQRDELIGLNAIKDKLFSVIAHDLKNPFNAIIGFSDLVLGRYDKQTDEKRKSLINTINQTARVTFHLLENLLEWSRNQQGAIKFTPKPVNVTALFSIAIEQVKEFAKCKEVKIRMIEPDGDLIGMVDENMIVTVLRNLLNNALKYSFKQGSVIIKAVPLNDNFIKILVIDNGVGMSDEIREDLFKAHENASYVGTAGEKGTGLGLIICKDFIETHNGEIGAESEPDKGSTFYFTIPKA
jgi:signal transduction histidine kinase/ligand-binding sensor domain-containing protein